MGKKLQVFFIDSDMKILDTYTLFPGIYDPIMKHINFQAWGNFILRSIEPDYPTSILDLGCGTGSLLKELPPMILKTGLDRSEKMLEVARKRVRDADFHKMDMISFELTQKYELALCTHDCLNYITEVYDLRSHFKCVRNALADRGYYFFDVSSEYNLKKNFHNQTIQEKFENVGIIWENNYDPQKKEIISTLNFEIRGENGPEYFREVHLQKYYSVEEIIVIAEEAGFSVLRIGSDYKKWKYDPNTSLINFLLKKN